MIFFLIKYRDLKTWFTSTSLEIPLSTTSFEPSPMYISFPKSCKVNGGSSFSSTSSPTSSMPVYAYSSNSVNSLSSVELQNFSKQSINSSGLPSPKRAIQKLKMKKKQTNKRIYWIDPKNNRVNKNIAMKTRCIIIEMINRMLDSIY